MRDELTKLRDAALEEHSRGETGDFADLFADESFRAIMFVVPAVPVPQPRQRTRTMRAKDGRTFVQNYTPADSPIQSFKATVRMAAREVYSGPPIAAGVGVNLQAVFVLPRPAGLPKRLGPGRLRHAKARPDLDNLMKGLCDSLTGLLWVDDGQLCDVFLRKEYAAKDEQPHVAVTVRAIRD